MRMFFIVLICVALNVGSALAQEEVLFVGGAPLDTYQPRVIIPLMEEAFKRNGIRFKAIHVPSSRSLLMSNSGEADGELHRVYEFHEVSDGRFPNLIRIESHLLSVHLAVFSLHPAVIAEWKDLRGFKVGFQRGRQNVHQYLTNNLEASDIYPVNADETALRMLAEKRLDYVVAESFESARMIRHHPEFKNIREVGKLIETRIYAYMHVKHQKLARTIAVTLDAMKADNTFQIIINDVREAILSGE